MYSHEILYKFGLHFGLNCTKPAFGIENDDDEEDEEIKDDIKSIISESEQSK